MLESEAKTKWCPFARLAVGAEVDRDRREILVEDGAPSGFNRATGGGAVFTIPAAAKCVGSACAMWQAGAEKWVAPMRSMADQVLGRDEGWEDHAPVGGVVTLTRPPNGDCGLKRG